MKKKIIVLIQNIVKECQKGKSPCVSGECIDDENFCDNLIDCKDGSDETIDVCQYKECSHRWIILSFYSLNFEHYCI